MWAQSPIFINNLQGEVVCFLWVGWQTADVIVVRPGAKVWTLGRQNEKNSSYVSMARNSIFGLSFTSKLLVTNIIFFESGLYEKKLLLLDMNAFILWREWDIAHHLFQLMMRKTRLVTSVIEDWYSLIGCWCPYQGREWNFSKRFGYEMMTGN